MSLVRNKKDGTLSSPDVKFDSKDKKMISQISQIVIDCLLNSYTVSRW